MKYADWLTKEQAGARLGVSERTVMRMADDKKIQQKLRPRPGGSPLAVFHPADVERLASERAAADSRPYVMPADAGAVIPAAPGAMLPAVSNAGAAADFAELLGAALALRVSPADKSRVTMAEAVAIGYVRDNLRDLVKAGTLENVGTPRRYRFRRRDLDAL